MTLRQENVVMILDLITKFPQMFPTKYWSALRFLILFFFDIGIVFFTYLAAFQLRFETFSLGEHAATFWQTVWIYELTYIATFYRLGLYQQVWRFANFRNAILIVASTFFACVLAMGAIYLFNKHQGYPRSVSIIVWSLSSIAIGFLRFSWRGINNLRTKIAKTETETENCFIYGAGGSGELLARYVKENTRLPYKVIGFIDDNRKKIGRQIQGYRIIGSGFDLERLAAEYRISSVLIAMNSSPSKVIREIVAKCQKIGLKTLILPEISNPADSTTLRPRKVDVKDLLCRSQKSIDNRSIVPFFVGKTVLVTGAGGTIGSEISRQILTTSPLKMILLDSSEFGLYSLENSLNQTKDSQTEIVYVMGSVSDSGFIERLFRENQIHCVMHAAAYKHVHLVEANPVSGVTNNVFGTKVVVDAAIRHGVGHFLLISSDKAVRPTGIMGKTKRVCELYLQAMNHRHDSKCKFFSVRFGNVLGSSGSVIPRFMDQIASGGPVTITHTNMTRYFMLVNEAVSLVLQSLILAKGGEIFVLKMGDPVNIYEMAKQLIALAGKKVGEDVDIVETGLRPGEKLFEELSYEGSENRTEYEDIFIVHPQEFDWESTLNRIETLIAHAAEGHDTATRNLIDEIVKDSFDQPVICDKLESDEPATKRGRRPSSFQPVATP